MTNTVQPPLALNLRPLDLKLMFKFIPNIVKDKVCPEGASLDELRLSVNMLAKAIQKKRTKRAATLRGDLKEGNWVLVRWGSGPSLGQTQLGVVKGIPQGNNIPVWFTEGVRLVPIWWLRHLYKYEELEPVKSFTDHNVPELPENHPTKTDADLKRWMEGVLEPMLDAKSAATLHNLWLSAPGQTQQKLDKIDEDRLSTLYYMLQKERIAKEKTRLAKFDIPLLKPGTWLTIKPDGDAADQDVALVSYDEKSGDLDVWYPDENATETVPDFWLQRVAVSKKAVTIRDGQVSDDSRLEFSPTFKTSTSLKAREVTVSDLRKVAEEIPEVHMELWESLWGKHNRSFHKLVKQRGQNFLNWFHRWADPETPNSESDTSLYYEPSSPLQVLMVLTYREDGKIIGQFLRAKIDLFEGTVETKDSGLSKEISL